jgi:hypothetical protein
VVIAHRLLESSIEAGGALGKPVASYRFHLADGTVASVEIRERDEISVIPDSIWSVGVLPFGAIHDNQPHVYPRDRGAWSDGGRRQEEVMRAVPRAYYLWTWVNSRPEVALTHIEIVPLGPRFIIAGITLGHADEHPFIREPAREITIVVGQNGVPAVTGDLEVEVDRGVVGYPYALPEASEDEFLNDQTYKGWGAPQNPHGSPAYVRLAAVPSATVIVKQGGTVLGSARWGDLERSGVVQPTPQLRVELVDRGRNWVRTRVLDEATGELLPCRIHFRSPEGIPYQPHGHHAHVNSNHDSWNVMHGGDVRLGQMTYAYIDGRCEGWLPRGEVLVDVARGFEYEPLRSRVSIAPGQQELVLRLRRWRNMNAERWFSGDTHVHFLSTQGSHLEARGEDLNVVNLLQAQWGHLFTSVEEFIGQPSVSADGQTIVYVSQENRQHFLGHLILLGLKEPVMPWSSDGPGEAELGGSLESTMADWADRCHAQGGTVVVPHFPIPNGELAALIATGRVDAVEFHRHSEYRHLEYYRYLNAGYRLPLAGGTDKMSSALPVGLYRTYVYIPPEQEFTYDTWRENLRLGRSFMSAGPLLDFSVDGARIGATVTLPGSGGRVEVQARAESIFPIHRLEIVQHGTVVAAVDDPAGTRSLTLQTTIPINNTTWLAARVSGGPSFNQPRLHFDEGSRGIFAHTSPIYVACGGAWALMDRDSAQHMLNLVNGSLRYTREVALHHRPGSVTHHHGEEDHAAYLQRPYVQASELIRQRLQDS